MLSFVTQLLLGIAFVKDYDRLYCFLGYADMRLIEGYESGSKGCARISFYKKGPRPLFPACFTLPSTSFTTPLLQNITSSILISTIQAKNPKP